MGRGGGSTGGGRSGGFSSGGSRGFSSRHSSGSGVSRGGGTPRSGNSSYSYRTGHSSRTPYRGRPSRTNIFISLFGDNSPMGGGFQTFSSNQKPFEGCENPEAAAGTDRNRGKIPNWYIFLMVSMVILSSFLLISAASARLTAKNTPAREKLPDGSYISTDIWIDDRINWLGNDSKVKSSMKYFQEKTGIQPYLLITDNINGKGRDVTDAEAESFLSDLYDSLYDDEGHMIFAFLEYAPSEYITYLYTGVAADSVMDSDARNIFLDNADRYYTDTSLTDEEFFAKVFKRSADAIMTDTAGHAKTATLYSVLSVIILILMAGGFIAFKLREKQLQEAEILKEVVSTPITPSPEETELERKYGDTKEVPFPEQKQE